MHIKGIYTNTMINIKPIRNSRVVTEEDGILKIWHQMEQIGGNWNITEKWFKVTVQVPKIFSCIAIGSVLFKMIAQESLI